MKLVVKSMKSILGADADYIWPWLKINKWEENQKETSLFKYYGFITNTQTRFLFKQKGDVETKKKEWTFCKKTYFIL